MLFWRWGSVPPASPAASSASSSSFSSLFQGVHPVGERVESILDAPNINCAVHHVDGDVTPPEHLWHRDVESLPIPFEEDGDSEIINTM